MTLIPHLIKNKNKNITAHQMLPLSSRWTSTPLNGTKASPPHPPKPFCRATRNAAPNSSTFSILFFKHLLSFFMLKLNPVFSQNTPSHVALSNGGAGILPTAQRYHPSQMPVRHTHTTCSFKAHVTQL